MAHVWNAEAYDRLPLPHTQWGRRVVARLEPDGVRRVLEAGCGTGRDTELILDRFPDVRVVAADRSREMLDQLERRLEGRRDRVEVIHGDLLDPLPVTDPVDAIVSVAAFHWIPDHPTLLANLASVIRPAGQLVFDCGGAGNVARVSAAAEAVLGRASATWTFAGVEETEARLRGAGFTDLEVALRPDPARFETAEQFESFLGIVVLGAHVAHLPEPERPAAVNAVAALLPDRIVDYVRLEVRARRAG